MKRDDERIKREVESDLAALGAEVRERGARAGLYGIAAATLGPVTQPRLHSMAQRLYGVPTADPAALAEQIRECEARRGAAAARVEARRSQTAVEPLPERPALPGWRRAVTVLALAGFAGLALMAYGVPAPWLVAGMLACLAAAGFVNAANFEQAARAALRRGGLWWGHRQECWAAGRLRRRLARLERLRWAELSRQTRISQWADENAMALEAEFAYALELGRKARELENTKTA